MAWPGNPHRPIAFSIAADFADLYVLRFSTHVALPTHVPYGPSPRPLCWAAASAAAHEAVALSRARAPPHAVKRVLNVATYHACIAAATEIAQPSGADITAAQARSLGIAPQLCWTRALAYDRRRACDKARAARALATTAQLYRGIIQAATAQPTSAHAVSRALSKSIDN